MKNDLIQIFGVNFHLLLEMDIVMMITTMKNVDGMVETVVEIM